jgi:CCR4-NOT transcriptional regulation complex NOT5 subunit
MEQFKVCEKETKTKTYSKEGLARETKIVSPTTVWSRNSSGN